MAINPYPFNPDPEATEFYNNPNPNAEADYLYDHDPKNVYSTDKLRYAFTTSMAYIKAKDLFEKGPQPDVWLSKLEQLTASLGMPQGNFWSDVGNAFGNTYANRFQEQLNNAFVSLNNLTNEWFEWFNKLPKEQRAQFEQAGINVALDGGSMLSGSQTSPQGIAPSPDFQGQQNQAFDNVVNFATSLSGGLLDLINTVNSVFSGASERSISLEGLNKQADTSLQSINMQRMQLGLNPISSLSSFDSPKDLSSRYLIDKNFYNNVSQKERAYLDSVISQGMTYTLNQSQKREGQFAAYADITQQLGQIYFGQLLYEQMASYERSKFVYENSQKINKMSLDSQEVGLASQRVALSSAVSSFSESSSLNDFHKKLIDYKKSVLSDWIQEAGSDSPNAWLFASLLMKSNFDMTEFMSPADVGVQYGQDVTDLLSTFIPKFSIKKTIKK